MCMSVSGGQTMLVSPAPAGGNGAFAAFFDGARPTARGSSSQTSESLVSADTDGLARRLRASGRADDPGVDRPDRRQRHL